jgi:CheY-like chemotaxis protein
VGGPAPGVNADVFAPPTARGAGAGGTLRGAIEFLLGRLLRVGLSPLVLAVGIGLALSLQPDQVLMAWLVSVVLWLPSSFVLFRVTFFPSPPDEGSSRSSRDRRTLARVHVLEEALGTLPLLWLSVWVGRFVQLPGWAALLTTLVVGALVLSRMARSASALLLYEVELELLEGTPGEASQRLERWVASPLLWGKRDYGWFLLSRVRFHRQEAPAALEALAQVHNTRRWPVDALAALMAPSAEGLQIAQRLRQARGARAPLLQATATAIELLVLLHEGRGSAVVARQDELAALPAGEARQWAALFVVAALAERDVDAARALLVREGLSLARARALGRCWPAVHARLQAI